MKPMVGYIRYEVAYIYLSNLIFLSKNDQKVKITLGGIK